MQIHRQDRQTHGQQITRTRQNRILRPSKRERERERERTPSASMRKNHRHRQVVIDVERALETLRLPPGVCFDELPEKVKETLRRRVVGGCGAGMRPVACPRCCSCAPHVVLRYFNNRRSPAQLQPRFRCTSCRAASGAFLEFYLNPASAVTAKPLLTRNSRILFGDLHDDHHASSSSSSSSCDYSPKSSSTPQPNRKLRPHHCKRRSISTVSIAATRRRYVSSTSTSCSSPSFTDSDSSDEDSGGNNVVHSSSPATSTLPNLAGTIGGGGGRTGDGYSSGTLSLRRSTRLNIDVNRQPQQQRPNAVDLRSTDENNKFQRYVEVPRRRRTREAADRYRPPRFTYLNPYVSPPPVAKVTGKRVRMATRANDVDDQSQQHHRQRTELPGVGVGASELQQINIESGGGDYFQLKEGDECDDPLYDVDMGSTTMALQSLEDLLPEDANSNGRVPDDFFALPISHPSIVAALGPTHLVFSLS